MTLAHQHLRRLWLRVATEWEAFFKGIRQSPELARAMQDFLDWHSITEAAKLRYRALKQQTIIPKLTTPTRALVPSLLDKNLWAQQHVRQMNPITQWATNRAIRAETEYVQSKAVAIEAAVRQQALPDPRMLLYRQRRFLRDTVQEVANTAEQVQLADPHIGLKFPFGEYRSREDARVRPTHAAMDGTVAVLQWPGWAWCRPACGWNCRCVVRWYSRSESFAKGWTDKSGQPRFEVRWSSPRAKANYLRGVPFHGNTDPHAFPSKQRDSIFPDAGPWMAARFTAGGGLAVAA